MYDYNEEEIERFGKEGGKYLLDHDIVDSADLEEVREFKEEMEEEGIEKKEDRRAFEIIKIKERSDDKMDDSAFNDNENLKDLIENFLEEEIDEEEFEKAKKKMPKALVAGLQEAFKILNEHKDYLDEDLKSAMQYISRILTKYPEPGMLPGRYPYPSKPVKKAMDWSQVQDMLFGGHIPADDEEIEKSSKSNPFPSITRALKIKEEAIEEIEDEMERDSFDPYDRMA